MKEVETDAGYLVSLLGFHTPKYRKLKLKKAKNTVATRLQMLKICRRKHCGYEYRNNTEKVSVLFFSLVIDTPQIHVGIVGAGDDRHSGPKNHHPQLFGIVLVVGRNNTLFTDGKDFFKN